MLLALTGLAVACKLLYQDDMTFFKPREAFFGLSSDIGLATAANPVVIASFIFPLVFSPILRAVSKALSGEIW